RPARRSVDGFRAQPLHGRRDARHPERSVAHAELGDDVVPVAHEMEDRRPERGLIEGHGLARRLDPQLGLDAGHPISLLSSSISTPSCQVPSGPRSYRRITPTLRKPTFSYARLAAW